MGPHSRAPKKNTSHGNEVLPHLLHISYKGHVTNEEVRAKIQQAIGPHEDLLTIVKRRKLQWYVHVSRSSGLAKTILQGTVKGGRRQGRERKRWEDNIREWTGLEFAKSQKAVENREKWRKLVAKSSGAPMTLRVNFFPMHCTLWDDRKFFPSRRVSHWWTISTASFLDASHTGVRH